MGATGLDGGSITQGLRCGLGDAKAHGASVSEVHEELLRIARAELARHRRGGTLNTRVLVNEVWIKLYGQGNDLDLASRKHFYATAAKAMRQVVIDYARARLTDMRGAGAEHLSLDSLDGQALPVDAQAENLLQMDNALRRLAELDPRLVEVVELRFFAGMEVTDVAKLLGVSEPTVKRDTRVAKAFIARELGHA